MACSSLTSVSIGDRVTTIGAAFTNLLNLENVYCMAEIVPPAVSSTFDNSQIEYATLHVPNGSISDYANTAPWSQFGSIVGLTPEQCATPTIAYVNGKLRFTCETEGVEYVPNVSCTPTKSQNGNEYEIDGIFTVSVYATKEGYADSEVATMAIDMGKMGDFDGDGQLTVTDVTSLVNAILGK